MVARFGLSASNNIRWRREEGPRGENVDGSKRSKILKYVNMTWTETASGIAMAKTAWYVGSIWVFEYLDIPQTQIAILGILMLFDFVTWIGKQWTLDPKQITSHKAWLGAVKKVGTLVILFTVALVLKSFELEADVYVKALLWIFIAGEAYSIIQNVYAVRTGKILPEYDVISIAIKQVWEWVKAFVEKSVSEKK